MAYTIWSRGRLIGETDLAFAYREHGHRCGWFHPNELGDRLMPAATGVAPAMRAAREADHDPAAEADVLTAVDQEEALELELRGPNGRAIGTMSIGIIDTHYLLSIPVDETEIDYDLTPEQQAEVDAWVEEWREAHGPDEPWRQEEEVELPRYQIQVELEDHNSVF